MKNLAFIMTLLLVSGCGPSNEEKLQIATIACNIIGSTRMMDASERIREVNSVREEIGESPFLEDDILIQKAIRYDMCKDLVVNANEFIERIELNVQEEIGSIQKLNMIEYRDVLDEIPDWLQATPEITRKNSAYQILINGGAFEIIDDGGLFGEAYTNAIESCEQVKSLVDLLEELGECPR